MLSVSDTLYLSAKVQLLLTICLVTLLWALYTRLQRFEFFRWWAWAWTASAAFLAAANVSLHLGSAWTPAKAATLLIVILSGFLQPVLLVFGGMSLRTPSRPSRRQFGWGIALFAVSVIVCFIATILLRDLPVLSFSVRNVIRTSGFAFALLFCCAVFWRHFRASGSRAAAITALFCFSYAFDEIVYFLSFAQILVAHWSLPLSGLFLRLAHFEDFAQSTLLFMDLADTCGICVGMILLLVERYRDTVSELELSERQRRDLAVDKAALQTEIEDRQRAELDLRRSEEFSRQVILNSPVAMVVSQGQVEAVQLVNEKFTNLFGYTAEEIREVRDWWPRAYPDPEYRRTLQRQWRTLIQKAHRNPAEKLVMEARVCCKDGSFRDVEIHLSLANDLYLVSFVDLTDRKKATEDLRESEAKFRLVADTVTSAIWLLQDSRLVYFNEEFRRMTGYSREELLSMDPWNLVHPDFRAENFARAEARLRGEPAPSRYQFIVLSKNGEKRWLDFSAALTEFNGKPAILAAALDITSAKRAEQDLREHAMNTDALISNLPLGIVIKDQNQLVRFCNPAFERMFLYTQAEIQGKHLDDLIASHDKEEAALLSAAIQRGGVVHTTARRRRKDGSLIDVELYGIKVFSDDTFIGAFAIYQDISERRKSEEKLDVLRSRLARAQEEERARIARDLHDDAGQRLALLSIGLEQLKQTSMKLRSSLTQQLESLVKAASEITSDVHNVSRRLHPSQVELLGLTAALANFCKDFAARNSMEIEFVHAPLSDKPSQNVALCLFRVAQEAVRNVQKHSGIRKALVQLDEDSGSLRLRISDEGVGFDPDSPDFSQGLGLLSMEERLHSLGGELFVHSRPGGGTCIEACIPLSPTVPA